MLHYWRDYTFQELAETDLRDAVALICVSSCEQHALHLPLSTDAVIGEYISTAAAAAAKRDVYLLPPLEYGFSEHHMKFPGTLSVSQKTLISMMEDIVRCIIEAGFRNVVLFNSHGGNGAWLSVAVSDLGIKYRDANIGFIKYWEFAADFIAENRKSPLGGIGHACEMETSLILARDENQVREYKDIPYEPYPRSEWFTLDIFAKNPVMEYRSFELYSDKGNMGLPSYASKEFGEAMIAHLTEKIAAFLDGYFV